MKTDDFFMQRVDNSIGGEVRDDQVPSVVEAWKSGDKVELFRLKRKDIEEDYGIPDGEFRVIAYDDLTSIYFAGPQATYYEREILNSFFYGLMRGWKIGPVINSTIRVATCQAFRTLTDEQLREIIVSLKEKKYVGELYDVRGEGKDSSKLIKALFKGIKEEV